MFVTKTWLLHCFQHISSYLSFPNLEPVCYSMPSSNCCCLTFIQISQEAGKVVWYFHLFKNFPQSVVIHIIKGIGMVKTLGFLHSSVGKESACNAGELGLIPGLGRFPGEGNGNPLQHSCLENPMDRRAWQATVHGVTRVGHDWRDLAAAAAANVFLELSCFFDDPANIGNLMSGSSAFSKTSLNIWEVLGSRTVEAWLGEFWALLY